MRFVHTADWQVGKPFASIRDQHKRSLVQQARIDVIRQIGDAAKEQGADFVVVSGDLFDSPSTDKATVSAACSAIGQIKVPVVAIPGNHDNGGPGSVWEQEFFQRERATLAPNLTILLEATPFELETAVILPCPLLRRHTVGDPTEWLRSPDPFKDLPSDRPRIILAHGSTQRFLGTGGDEDEDEYLSNLIDLDRIVDAEIDYVALGDWHGTSQVTAKAWYAGTPEPDRFPKASGYDAGNILVVEARRGSEPQVTKANTGKLNWLEVSFDLAGDTALNELESRLTSLLEQRTGQDLLSLSLTGSIGIEAFNRLEQILEYLEARLLLLKLANRVLLAPTEEEIQMLTQSGADPLVARVATQLATRASSDDEDAAVARVGLRELHGVWKQESTS